MAKKYAPKLRIPLDFDDALRALLETPLPPEARRGAKATKARKRAHTKKTKPKQG